MKALHEQIHPRLGKTELEYIVRQVPFSPDKFNELLSLLEPENPLSERAAWFMSYWVPVGKLSFKEWASLLDLLDHPRASDSLKRNIVRLLVEEKEVEEDISGRVWDCCFNLAGNRDESIAVRSFSFHVLQNMLKSYPELAGELLDLALMETDHASSGLRNRIEKVIKDAQRRLK